MSIASSGTTLYVVAGNLSLAASYSPAQLPTYGDSVIIDGEQLSTAISTGFVSNLPLDTFEVRDNYSFNIMSLGAALTFSANTFKYNGSGTMYYKCDGSDGAYQTGLILVDSNNQTNALVIDSDANLNTIARIHVRKGYVTIAATCGDIIDVELSYRNSPDRDAIVIVPASDYNIITLTQCGGQLDCERGVTEGVQYAGTWEQSVDRITYLRQASGLCVYNYDDLPFGSINGTIDFTQSRERKTATIRQFPKGVVRSNPASHTITYSEMGRTSR